MAELTFGSGITSDSPHIPRSSTDILCVISRREKSSTFEHGFDRYRLLDNIDINIKHVTIARL